MWRKWTVVVIGACLSYELGIVARAEDVPARTERGAVLEVTEENDWFAGTDRHYTQGFRAVYLGAEHSQSHWLGEFAAVGIRVKTWRWGFQIGQSIFTPESLDAEGPLPNDRPYAGWLYAGPVLQRRGVTPGAGVPVLESVQLQLGVVGPGSLAKEEQNAAHFLGGFGLAEGWSHQLGNEPGGALKYQRTWRLALVELQGWSSELLPHTGASLGNVDTSTRLGVTLRTGWRLPDDFGVQTADSLGVTDGGRAAAAVPQRPACYLFGRVEGRAVARNEFLDGSMFRKNSPQVDRRPIVCEIQGGVALAYARLRLSFAMVYRTKEFDSQACEDAFGSVSLGLNF